jgi:hypothetical protein
MIRLAAALMLCMTLFSCLTVRFHTRTGTKAPARVERQVQAPPETPVPEAAGFVRTPLESLRFWRTVMTPAVASRYKAKGFFTQCNVFVGDTLEKYLGPEVFARVFPDGVKGPDVMYREWQESPNLRRLSPSDTSLERVQELADSGYVVLLAYFNKNGKSHLAFVGNSRLVMFTLPKIKKLEGKKITDMEASWLPVVVQAGTYTGVTSVAYASNSWLDAAIPLYESGIVMFYLIKS